MFYGSSLVLTVNHSVIFFTLLLLCALWFYYCFNSSLFLFIVLLLSATVCYLANERFHGTLYP